MSAPAQQSRLRATRIAESAVERARLRVVPRVRTASPRFPFVALVSILLVAGVVGLLMLNTTMQQNSFKVNDLENRAEQLGAQKEGLEMELAQLNAPQRIAERAADLGMVRGGAPAFIDLRTGKVGASTPVADPSAVAPFRDPEVTKPESLSPKPRVRYIDAPRTERANGDTGAASAQRGSGAGRNGNDSTPRGDRSTR